MRGWWFWENSPLYLARPVHPSSLTVKFTLLSITIMGSTGSMESELAEIKQQVAALQKELSRVSGMAELLLLGLS